MPEGRAERSSGPVHSPRALSRGDSFFFSTRQLAEGHSIILPDLTSKARAMRPTEGRDETAGVAAVDRHTVHDHGAISDRFLVVLHHPARERRGPCSTSLWCCIEEHVRALACQQSLSMTRC